MMWLSFLQLKAYAKFHGIPKTYNNDDSGFSLEESMVTAPFEGLIQYRDIDLVGNVLIFLILQTFHSEIRKELPKIQEHKLLVTRIATFSTIVCLAEIVELIIVKTYSSQVSVSWFIMKFLWMGFFVLSNFVRLYIEKNSLCLDAFIITIFLELIFSSFQAAFFLLLVYPIKVVSLFTYTVTFTYFVVYFSVNFKRVLPNVEQLGSATHGIMFILVYFSALSFSMLFLLTMTKAAVFASGVHGVILLLPPVFITAGIWMLKKKVLNKKEAND